MIRRLLWNKAEAIQAYQGRLAPVWQNPPAQLPISLTGSVQIEDLSVATVYAMRQRCLGASQHALRAETALKAERLCCAGVWS